MSEFPHKMRCGCCGAMFRCSGKGYHRRRISCKAAIKEGVCTCPACFRDSVCYSKADYREYYRLYLACWGIPENIVPLLTEQPKIS